jgi:hypothetical protein
MAIGKAAEPAQRLGADVVAPTDSEIRSQMTSKVTCDRRYDAVLHQAKEDLQRILLDWKEEQVTRIVQGEGVASSVEFPLLHPKPLTTLEDWLARDLSINIKEDVVDDVLSGLSNELLKLVFAVVPVANDVKNRLLKEQNEHLVARMQTLEEHLQDRTKKTLDVQVCVFPGDHALAKSGLSEAEG